MGAVLFADMVVRGQDVLNGKPDFRLNEGWMFSFVVVTYL